ncbi:TIGR04452 family lipoprotein [Leptospira langatensis]|uniref:TIGR04452 family lipoprotein n=1 Tax=Leptospira langatensis TaxID=2484983 RepID=A0A5F1ZX78_9LEPT|nr:TIGR04452 family lipoprotein [Leptospira langatensis]TGJ98561.1 TIGR04452 family lipoprotein [Leptospira langatensis]TGL43475.1 TIGR04452 family lipoprotein [Leptospira langatensis]
MRVKILAIVSFLFILSNCVVANQTGFTDRYKGSVAKSKIQEAATTGAALYAVAASDASGATYINNILLPPILANFSPTEYYNKSDVDSCAEEIKNFAALGVRPVVTVLFGQCTNIQPDGLVTQKI